MCLVKGIEGLVGNADAVSTGLKPWNVAEVDLKYTASKAESPVLVWGGQYCNLLFET